MALVELRGVSKTFPPRTRKAPSVTAIDGVDLTVEEGDIYGIIGYSGAGKSTLVRLVNALEPATAGTVTVAGTDMTKLGESELNEARRDIGMIFQQFNLFNSRTVWGNVAFPLKLSGIPTSEVQQRVSDLLHFVGLADKAHSYPDQLSGGQKQRVGIARALATNPRLLLADESTSALDPETTSEVLDLLKQVNQEFGITIIVITHEMEVVRKIANKVAVMEAGKIVEDKSVYDIFARPSHPVTKRFVSTVVDNAPDGELLASLRAKHDGTLVTISFDDSSAEQSTIFKAFAAHQLDFELAHGGVEDIQGRTFGHLTFAVKASPTSLDPVLDELSRGFVTEVL